MLRLLRVRNLLAVAVILVAMSAVYGAMHTTQGIRGGMNDPVLAAADYRAPIVDVETILFSPEPLAMEDRIRLAKAIDAMRRELDTRGGTNLAKYGARELGTLAGMSRGLGNLRGADLGRVRQNWMRIRSNTFSDESWFRFSESDPVAPRENPFIALNPDDRAALDRLGSLLDRIEETIARGERDCDRLGEPGDDASAWDPDRGRAFADSWSEWGVGWGSQLESIRGWLPPVPSSESPATVRFVHASATRALEELAAIPREGRGRWQTPLRIDWTRRFENARKQVRDARSWVDRAEKGLGV